MFAIWMLSKKCLNKWMHGQCIVSLVCLIDDIIVNKCHRMEEFENDAKLEYCFFVGSTKSHVDQSKSIRPDSFSSREDKGRDVVDKRVYFFVIDKCFCLLNFFIDIRLQDSIKSSFELSDIHIKKWMIKNEWWIIGHRWFQNSCRLFQVITSLQQSVTRA